MKQKTHLAILLLSLLFLINSCQKGESSTALSTDLIENEAAIKFEVDQKHLGRLQDGERVTVSFRFSNTGKHPLLITEANGNCGCTVTDFPSAPIAQGGTGLITVTYDSKGNRGLRISKEITVVANTRPTQTKLRITAEVY